MHSLGHSANLPNFSEKQFSNMYLESQNVTLLLGNLSSGNIQRHVKNIYAQRFHYGIIQNSDQNISQYGNVYTYDRTLCKRSSYTFKDYLMTQENALIITCEKAKYKTVF